MKKLFFIAICLFLAWNYFKPVVVKEMTSLSYLFMNYMGSSDDLQEWNPNK